MRMIITIDTSNAAFEDPQEIHHVLGRFFDLVSGGITADQLGLEGIERLDGFNLRDSNGNTVGTIKIVDSP